MPSLDHNIPISLSIFTVNQLALFWTEKFTPLQVTHELPEWFRRILLKVASHVKGCLTRVWNCSSPCSCFEKVRDG
jgi:hypothetical protein